MDSKLFINQKRLDDLANRKSKESTKIIGIIGLLFILVAIISLPFTEKMDFNFSTIFYMILSFLISVLFLSIILFIIYKFFFFNIRDFWSNKFFEFSNNRISTNSEYKKLNVFNKLGYRKMSVKYGLNMNQVIDLNDLVRTKIKKNGIFFYDHSNFFNPIVFPKEMENYSEIKKTINKEHLKFKVNARFKIFEPNNS